MHIAQVAKIKRLYTEEQLSRCVIAQQLGCSTMDVYSVLRTSGLLLSRNKRKVTSIETEEIKKLYVKEHKSRVQISFIIGCSTYTVAKVLAAANISAHVQGQCVFPSADEVEKIKKLYVVEGKSIHAIMQCTDYTDSVIRRVLQGEGVKLRSCTGGWKRKRRVLGDSEIANIKRLYIEEKKSIREIAKETKYPINYIFDILQCAKVSMRKAGDWRHVTSEKLEEIKRLYAEYRSSILVGELVGLSHVYVLQLLRREGIAVYRRSKNIDKIFNLYIDEGKTIKEIARQVTTRTEENIWEILYLGFAKYSEDLYAKLVKYALNEQQTKENKDKRALLQKGISYMQGLLNNI
jgi:transposase-like protein/uncharacterized OsmC-like protein